MISALAWVPRGAAKPVVEEALPADEELVDFEVCAVASRLGQQPARRR